MSPSCPEVARCTFPRLGYPGAALAAWGVFTVTFALWVTAFFGLERGVAATLVRALGGGAFFGLAFILVLAALTGPLLWWTSRRSQRSLVPLAAALAPVHVIAMWWLMRGANETVASLFGAWQRFPGGEWGLWGPASLVAGLVFAEVAARLTRGRG